MASDDELARIAQLFNAHLGDIRDRAAVVLDRAWRTISPVDDVALGNWLRVAVPMLDAAKVQAAASTVAYVQAYVGQVTGEAATIPVDAATIAAGVRGGAPTTDVLRRPVVATRVALAGGTTLVEALNIGRARAVQYARTDPHLAFRDAFRAAAETSEFIVGYRRVPDGGACKFCLLAATQRYKVRDLMPLHPACGCTSAPIVGDHDPGRVLDAGLVDRLMTEDPALGLRGDARQRARDLVAKSRADAEAVYAVHNHGELGPVLTPKGVEFKGPDEVD